MSAAVKHKKRKSRKKGRSKAPEESRYCPIFHKECLGPSCMAYRSVTQHHFRDRDTGDFLNIYDVNTLKEPQVQKHVIQVETCIFLDKLLASSEQVEQDPTLLI